MAKLKDLSALSAAFGAGMLAGYKLSKSGILVPGKHKENPVHMVPNAKLAYSIAGIEQNGEGTVSFLTATGDNYVQAVKPPHIMKAMETRDNRCIRNHTWDEVAEMIRRDPHVFDGCLKNGCVKSVDLDINDTLRNPGWTKELYQSETGDGPAALLYELKDEFSVWQPGHGNWKREYGDTTGGYPASRARAVLNGCDEHTDVKRANGTNIWCRDDETGPDSDWNWSFNRKDLTDIRTITTGSCLLSCFPRELQDSIVPKAVKSVVDDNGTLAITHDRLWLPSETEVGGSGYKAEGPVFQMFCEKAFSKKRIACVVCRDGSSGAGGWWLRSLYGSISGIASGVSYYGDLNYWYASNGSGLAPGFVLGRRPI